MLEYIPIDILYHICSYLKYSDISILYLLLRSKRPSLRYLLPFGFVERTQEEAQRWKKKVHFACYDGPLASFYQQHFKEEYGRCRTYLVFTKSTTVKIPSSPDLLHCYKLQHSQLWNTIKVGSIIPSMPITIPFELFKNMDKVPYHSVQKYITSTKKKISKWKCIKHFFGFK